MFVCAGVELGARVDDVRMSTPDRVASPRIRRVPRNAAARQERGRRVDETPGQRNTPVLTADPCSVDDSSNPHDKLFKETFSRVELAAAELQSIFAPELSAQLDWSTLELATSQDERVGEGERSHDLLFQVQRTGDAGSAYIFVLFEHQRTSDSDMALRLLDYMVRIWRRARRELPSGSLLPPIMPVVLSHAPGGWRAVTRFVDLLGPAGPARAPFEPYTPDFVYVVDDLSKLDDEGLRARRLPAELTVTLWAFRDGPRGEPAILAGITAFGPEIEEVSSGPEGPDAQWLFLGYLSISAGKKSPSPDTLLQALRSTGPATRRAAMNNLEKFAEKYRLVGLEQGREEERRRVLCSLMQKKFGEVDPQLLARMDSLPAEALDEALDRILTADSVEAVLGE